MPAYMIDGSLAISEAQGAEPHTCTFKCTGTAPIAEQIVTLNLGTEVIFSGFVQNVEEDFYERPDNIEWTVTAINYMWKLNRRRPFGTFTNMSVTAIIHQLFSRYGIPEISLVGVQSGLPSITIFIDGSLTWSECLAALAEEIGAKCRLDPTNILYFFLSESGESPTALTSSNTTLMVDTLKSKRDMSQLRNRVFVRAAGSTAAQDVNVGATSIPVEDIQVYPESGYAITGGQILRFERTNRLRLGAGAIPPAPLLSQCTETNLGARTTPANVQVRTSFVYPDGHESAPGPPSPTVYFDGSKKICLNNIPFGGLGVSRRVYVSIAELPNEPDWTSESTAELITKTDIDEDSASEDFKGWVTGEGTFSVSGFSVFSTLGTPSIPCGSIWVEAEPIYYPNHPLAGYGPAYAQEYFTAGKYILGDGFSRASDITNELTLIDTDCIWNLGSGVQVDFQTLPPGFTILMNSVYWAFYISGGGMNNGDSTHWTCTDPEGNTTADRWGSSIPQGDPAYNGVNGLTMDPLDIHSGFWRITGNIIGNFGDYIVFNNSTGSGLGVQGQYVKLAWTKRSLPKGEIQRGDTTLAVECPMDEEGNHEPLSDVFCETGGFAKVGNQYISYSGIDPVECKLIGIPPDGPGAIGCDHTNPEEVDPCGVVSGIDVGIDRLETVRSGLSSAERSALTSGYADALIAGFLGTELQFMQQQLEFYELYPEGDPRLVVPFTGATVLKWRGIVAEQAPPVIVGPGLDGNGCEAGNGSLKDVSTVEPSGSSLSNGTIATIKKGDAIDIWVQRDDLESQATYGIREGPIITDGELKTLSQIQRRADAELELFSQPIVTVTFSTRDRKIRVGRSISADGTITSLEGSFIIQQVDISEIGEHSLDPLRSVTASSVKFTLADLLQRVVMR